MVEEKPYIKRMRELAERFIQTSGIDAYFVEPHDYSLNNIVARITPKGEKDEIIFGLFDNKLHVHYYKTIAHSPSELLKYAALLNVVRTIIENEGYESVIEHLIDYETTQIGFNAEVSLDEIEQSAQILGLVHKVITLYHRAIFEGRLKTKRNTY